MIKKCWSFPGNNNGQIRGVADAGIETFKGNLIASLARETCQNSLDALGNGNKCVKIEIENHSILTTSMPGYDDFKNIIDNLYDYWKNNSDKAEEFLREAKRTLSAYKINVLRISDYNTTGLLDPYSDELDSIWNEMTKIDGGGNKSHDKNGGFGIGKNAPYANSSLRTVFYRTYNDNYEHAAQGIARLLSYPLDRTRALKTMTSGFGYFGNEEYNQPVDHIECLDQMSIRDEVGTDLFIFGFNNESNWEKDIIIEILNNFLVSIYNEQLIVKVGKTELSKDNLPFLINNYIKQNKKADCKTCYANYQVLTNENSEYFEQDFHGMGTLKLKVLVDPKLELDKKILRTRKSGMKLFARMGVARAVNFSAILLLEGEKLKQYFKNLEPPTHDKWEADRNTTNKREAQNYIDEINEWEQQIIWSLGENSDCNEVNVEGLSDVLADESGDNKGKTDEPSDSLEHTLSDIIEIQPDNKKVIKGTFTGHKGNNKSKNNKEEKGNLNDESGEFDAKRKLKGERIRKKKTKHKGDVSEDGQETVYVPETDADEIILETVRIIKLKDHTYKISFTLPRTIGKGKIEINSIGENNKANKLKLLSVQSISNCDNLSLHNGVIEFDNIIGETKSCIIFELMDNHNYAMEVKVYEY